MPVSAAAAKTAAEQVGLNSNGAQVQNVIQNHIQPKHQDRAHLQQWLIGNPREADLQAEGYGIRSFFTAHGWQHLVELIECACYFPTSLHVCAGFPDTRALVFVRIPSGQNAVGSMLPVTNTPLPPGMPDPNLLWGLVLVIAINPPALVTAFPSDVPTTAKLT
jgi:hypothetical protein